MQTSKSNLLVLPFILIADAELRRRYRDALGVECKLDALKHSKLHVGKIIARTPKSSGQIYAIFAQTPDPDEWLWLF